MEAESIDGFENVIRAWQERSAILKEFWFAPLLPAPVVLAWVGLKGPSLQPLVKRGFRAIRIGASWFFSRAQLERRSEVLAEIDPDESEDGDVEAELAPTSKSAPAAEAKGYWTAQQVATFIGKSVKTVQRLVEKGELRKYEIGGHPRYRESDVRLWASGTSM